MNQTIREYLTRRVRLILAVGLASWLVIIAGAFIPERVINEFMSPVGGIAFLVAILFLQFGMKCPRCSVRLGQIAFPLAIPGLKPKPNFCPYCGVSFDTPRHEQLAVASQTSNPIR